MLSYTRLCRVDVCHPYFKGDVCRHLVFTPEAETKVFLDAWGIRLGSDGSAMVLQAETQRLAGLWRDRDMDGQPRVLDFQVRSGDPLCLLYTALERGRQPPCFSPGDLPVGELVRSEGQALFPGRSASPAGMGCGATPVARVLLPLNGGAHKDQESWLASLGSQHVVRLTARSTIWKYLLLGDWPEQPLRLVDLAGQVAFGEPIKERLPNGATALAIRSRAPIQLEEYSSRRFQLMDVSVRPERVVIKRLPVATPRNIYFDATNDTTTIVSEIYVSH